MGEDGGGGMEGEGVPSHPLSLSLSLSLLPGHLIAVHVDDRVGDLDLGGHGWEEQRKAG